MKPLYADHNAQNALLSDAQRSGAIDREEWIRNLANDALNQLERDPHRGGLYGTFHYSQRLPISFTSAAGTVLPDRTRLHHRITVDLTPCAVKTEEARFLVENMIREQLDEADE